MPPVSNPYELSTELCGCEDWSSGWEEYVDPTTVGGTLLSSRVMFGCVQYPHSVDNTKGRASEWILATQAIAK